MQAERARKLVALVSSSMLMPIEKFSAKKDHLFSRNLLTGSGALLT